MTKQMKSFLDVLGMMAVFCLPVLFLITLGASIHNHGVYLENRKTAEYYALECIRDFKSWSKSNAMSADSYMQCAMHGVGMCQIKGCK